MSKRKLTLSLALVLAVAMVLGVTLSSVTAKPPTPATYKCISGDMYLCTAVGFNPLVECCESTGEPCGPCGQWYWYSDGMFTYTCTEPNGGGTCVLHNCP